MNRWAGTGCAWALLFALAWPAHGTADGPTSRWRFQPVGLEFGMTLNEVRRRCSDLRRLTKDPTRAKTDSRGGQVAWFSLRCGRQMGSPYLLLTFTVDEAGRALLGGVQVQDRRGARILRAAKRGMDRYQGETGIAGVPGGDTVVTRGRRTIGTLPWFVFGQLTEVRSGASTRQATGGVDAAGRRMGRQQ